MRQMFFVKLHHSFCCLTSTSLEKTPFETMQFNCFSYSFPLRNTLFLSLFHDCLRVVYQMATSGNEQQRLAQRLNGNKPLRKNINSKNQELR